jgi:hypothetical protein
VVESNNGFVNRQNSEPAISIFCCCTCASCPTTRTHALTNTRTPTNAPHTHTQDLEVARGCFRHLRTLFQELEECRAFELLKGQGDRVNYLSTCQVTGCLRPDLSCRLRG